MEEFSRRLDDEVQSTKISRISLDLHLKHESPYSTWQP